MTVKGTRKLASPVADQAPPVSERITSPRPQGEQMLLELRKIQRYHHKNQLFVAGEVYRVTREVAQELLQLTFNGRPVFTRYKPKVEPERVRLDQGPIINDMTTTQVAGSTEAASPRRAITLEDDPNFLKGLLGEGSDDDAGTGLDDNGDDGDD